MKQTFLRFLFFVALGIVPHMVNAQIPADLSKIKTSQITDAQLNQFLQQAQSSGMTEGDLLQEFQKRGLPESEIQAIVSRIKMMTGVDLSANEPLADTKESSSTKRKFKGETQKFRMPEKPSRVFGAELFSGIDPFLCLISR